ncbi:uncharacterized protein LOC111711113 [Eurytemora carolleeae]|uniref:uncharacterized protein LOC111711113 n=1 Tax=Eurytemora carolleeae TaxID=1294199 RepID=UPI000C765F04|nr:uncharacterized protein LOC111711113 [Eurytemora carolleeae]|eukprot:XP_023341134.1 uncharacterized protein LOC111711113 [Eurytemora affinis]
MATLPAKMARTPVTKAKFFTSTINKKKDETKEKKKNPDLEEKLSVADLSGISVIKTSPPPKRKVFFGDRHAEALKIKDEKVLRSAVSDLEKKVCRLETLNSAANIKINTLNTQLQEKDRYIRDLELRLPRVLQDISKGIGGRDGSGRTRREVQESMRRNHKLNAKMKELECELGWKEKEKEGLRAACDLLRAKCKERDQHFRERVAIFNEERNQLTDQLMSMEHIKEENLLLESQCKSLSKINRYLQEKLNAGQQEMNEKLSQVRSENTFLYSEISSQYDELLQTEEEIKELERIIVDIFRKYQELRPDNTKHIPHAEIYPEHAKLYSEHDDLYPEHAELNPEQAELYPEHAELHYEHTEPFPEHGELHHIKLGINLNEKERNLNNTWPMVGDQVHDMYEHEDLEMFYLNHYSLHLPRENILFETDEDWDESFERSEDDSGREDEGFEDSLDKSMFCSRVENLDLKLELLLNRLNSTTSIVQEKQ